MSSTGRNLVQERYAAGDSRRTAISCSPTVAETVGPCVTGRVSPVIRFVTLYAAPALAPMSAKLAVMVWLPEHRFTSPTAMFPPLSGPAMARRIGVSPVHLIVAGSIGGGLAGSTGGWADGARAAGWLHKASCGSLSFCHHEI